MGCLQPGDFVLLSGALSDSFPLMISSFFASHLFLMKAFLPFFFWMKCLLPTLLDETFPPFLFESWPISTLPSENGLRTEENPVAL